MEEELSLVIEDTEDKMKSALDHLENELLKVRAGKASPHLLDGIKVNYYGTETPLNQVSNVSITDAKTITIQPWEKSMIDSIEKSIMQANIGITPVNNGELIRLNIPPLTEERRRDLVKQIKKLGEDTKVSIRNTRRDANEELKRMKKEGLAEDLEKDGEAQVQKLTDNYIEQVDKHIQTKENEVMTV
ncbi:MAG: ribosome recycling factor [Bacteroidales bacterium]|nr:ribosome recycling factor [Bacteroidales bacterium]